RLGGPGRRAASPPVHVCRGGLGHEPVDRGRGDGRGRLRGRRGRLRRVGARGTVVVRRGRSAHDGAAGGGGVMDVVPSRPRGSPLLRTPFIQPREPAFWLYLVIVAATGFVSISEQALFRRISPTGWVLSGGLLALDALPVLS